MWKFPFLMYASGVPPPYLQNPDIPEAAGTCKDAESGMPACLPVSPAAGKP